MTKKITTRRQSAVIASVLLVTRSKCFYCICDCCIAIVIDITNIALFVFLFPRHTHTHINKKPARTAQGIKSIINASVQPETPKGYDLYDDFTYVCMYTEFNIFIFSVLFTFYTFDFTYTFIAFIIFKWMPSCCSSTVVVIIVAVVTIVVIFCFRLSLFLALLANFCVVLVVCRASAQHQNVNLKLYEYVLFCIFIFFYVSWTILYGYGAARQCCTLILNNLICAFCLINCTHTLVYTRTLTLL